MEITDEQAKKLCSALEFELWLDSAEPRILSLPAESLRKRAHQAEKLIELWGGRTSDEKERAFGKVGSARRRATTGYITARQKAEMFEEVERRFAARLQVVLANPDAPLRDTIKYKKETGKLNKSAPDDDDPVGRRVWV
ncbi:MAG: hypothetical protein K8I27_06890 [Planctomycetes bacterium]|nr:hypothetical protein [Planctomycetota bacterium]